MSETPYLFFTGKGDVDKTTLVDTTLHRQTTGCTVSEIVSGCICYQIGLC